MRWYKPIRLAQPRDYRDIVGNPLPPPGLMDQINIVRNSYFSPPQTRIEALDNLSKVPVERLGNQGIEAIFKAIDDPSEEVGAKAISVAIGMAASLPQDRFEELGTIFMEMLDSSISSAYGETPNIKAIADAVGNMGSRAASFLPRLREIYKKYEENLADDANDPGSQNEATGFPQKEMVEAIARIEETSNPDVNDITLVSRMSSAAENLLKNWRIKYYRIVVPGKDVMIKRIGTESVFLGKLKKIEFKKETEGGITYDIPMFLIELPGGQQLTSRPLPPWDPNSQYEVWLINEVKDVRESKSVWVRIKDPTVREFADESGTALGALLKIEGDIATVRIMYRILEVPLSSLTSSRRAPTWGGQFGNSPFLPGDVVSFSGEQGVFIIDGLEKGKIRIVPLDAKRGAGHFLADSSQLKYVGRRTLRGVSPEPDIRSPQIREPSAQPHAPAQKPAQPPSPQKPQPQEM